VPAILAYGLQLGLAGLAGERAPHHLQARPDELLWIRQTLEAATDDLLAREAEDLLVRRVDVDALKPAVHSIIASADALKISRYCASLSRSALSACLRS